MGVEAWDTVSVSEGGWKVSWEAVITKVTTPLYNHEGKQRRRWDRNLKGNKAEAMF